MRLEHDFTVPVPVEQAWAVLLDLPRVAPCMPGATLTEVDGDTFAGTVKVKLGPIALTYHGKGHIVERDEVAHRAVIEASGKDSRSAGTAAATVTANLVPDGTGTRVEVVTELTITGRPAQFGRGMIADVSAKLIGQFADCLASTITAAPAAAAAVPGPEPAAATAAEPEPAAAVPAPVPVPVRQAEPIDLLRLTGSTRTGRRLALMAGGAVVAGVAAWLVVRWLTG